MSNIVKKVFVAMSGGVDSSVAAALLKKKGYDVVGVHMVCWDGCENSEDRRDAMRVAAVLDIPFLTWDFREEYKKEVYDYMISEYIAGRTPNPDVMCNKQIKFGIFLKKSLENGADFIATGHYVLAKHGALYQAKDLNKDQSYFLWTLTQDQLKHCLFPIGDYLKPEVRELARKFKLPISEKKDSQGLCFVGKVDFLDFLKEKIPAKDGDVLDFSGKKIGTHEGAHFYTIGQRHGLSIGGRKNPVYIAKKDLMANTITVAEKNNEVLYKKEIKIENINWISQKPELPLNCIARIRYRQPLQKASVYENKIIFDVPQRAVAQSQSVVFYEKEGDLPADRQVLGGGVIK